MSGLILGPAQVIVGGERLDAELVSISVTLVGAPVDAPRVGSLSLGREFRVSFEIEASADFLALVFGMVVRWRPPRLSRQQIVDVVGEHARQHRIGGAG